jgi:hypothetical protein
MTSSSSRSRYLLALDRMIESVQHDVRDLAPGNFNTRDFLSGELKGLRAARAYAEAEEARIALSEKESINAAPQGTEGYGLCDDNLGNVPAVAAPSSGDKTQQSVGEHDTDCNLKRDDHQRLEGCNCSLRVLAVVRLAAEGSDWKRDSGESLASWVQRRLARSHVATNSRALEDAAMLAESYGLSHLWVDGPIGVQLAEDLRAMKALRSASERDKGWHSAQTAPYGKCQKCGIERWQPWPECAEDGCPFAPTER